MPKTFFLDLRRLTLEAHISFFTREGPREAKDDFLKIQTYTFMKLLINFN
jgi:hypothetical protein